MSFNVSASMAFIIPLDDVSPFPVIPSSGAMSFCALNAIPLFASRFIWMARLGIMHVFSFNCTGYVSNAPLFSTHTLPAITSGLSNHVDSIIPPYFSVFMLTYTPSFSISGDSFILNAGESECAA